MVENNLRSVREKNDFHVTVRYKDCTGLFILLTTVSPWGVVACYVKTICIKNVYKNHADKMNKVPSCHSLLPIIN